ncbi:division/outer membrane stress-associated lipid-binding lipoprotein [Dongshaea marina]|uniref:division/outer membrane stress-associated lipid-binding lipoprotein n=1 Tax=Dongshaea marina TaxID=2047966 RepID=UPI000D3E26CE|nr:division/outer membrane stress-associated lipid-binding lipoprotein [Dongshaea marina]
MKRLIYLTLLLASTLSLSGCVGLFVAGTATTVSAANDQRTLGSQIDDQTIEFKAGNALFGNKTIHEKTNISVISTNGRVLMIGEAPTEELRAQAVALVQKVPGVKQIYNEIRIAEPVSMSTRMHDSWLTSKVKTQLFGNKNVNPLQIKVVTENGEVFLIGVTSREDAEHAVNVARNVDGVKRVVKVFQYTD